MSIRFFILAVLFCFGGVLYSLLEVGNAHGLIAAAFFLFLIFVCASRISRALEVKNEG